MVLALADYLNTNWATILWIIAVLVSISLTAQIVALVRRSTLRGSYTWLIIGAGVGLLIASGWYSFGWETLHTDTGWAIRQHRMFGRVTSLGYYTDRSSRAEATVRYKWSDPWIPGREELYDFEVAMEDRNHDGRWDTWMEPTGETNNGDPVLVIRADTTLDGEPDFEVRGNASTLESSYRLIETQRGF